MKINITLDIPEAKNINTLRSLAKLILKYGFEYSLVNFTIICVDVNQKKIDKYIKGKLENETMD